jgi:hypothetical protein
MQNLLSLVQVSVIKSKQQKEKGESSHCYQGRMGPGKVFLEPIIRICI